MNRRRVAGANNTHEHNAHLIVCRMHDVAHARENERKARTDDNGARTGARASHGAKHR